MNDLDCLLEGDIVLLRAVDPVSVKIGIVATDYSGASKQILTVHIFRGKSWVCTYWPGVGAEWVGNVIDLGVTLEQWRVERANL